MLAPRGLALKQNQLSLLPQNITLTIPIVVHLYM